MTNTELNPKILEELDQLVNTVGVSVVLLHLAKVCETFKDDSPRWTTDLIAAQKNWIGKGNAVLTAMDECNYMDEIFPHT